jgi:hypothetical protein
MHRSNRRHSIRRPLAGTRSSRSVRRPTAKSSTRRRAAYPAGVPTSSAANGPCPVRSACPARRVSPNWAASTNWSCPYRLCVPTATPDRPAHRSADPVPPAPTHDAPRPVTTAGPWTPPAPAAARSPPTRQPTAPPAPALATPRTRRERAVWAHPVTDHTTRSRIKPPHRYPASRGPHRPRRAYASDQRIQPSTPC